MTPDPYDLDRFVSAQAPVFSTALAELEAGRKRSHWMWFVFPQLRALGQSARAIRYGIASLDEARAYLAHPVLGPRLGACTDAVLAVRGMSLHEVFGTPDDVKFVSSMTLFAKAASAKAATAKAAADKAAGNEDLRFAQAIDTLCGGRADARTLAILRTGGAPA